MDEPSFQRMLHHEALLQAWNPRINLTRITDPVETARRHFGEALFVAREANLSGAIADLGAGPGFPGLPIAACRPDLEFTEVESLAKKATFLREVSRSWRNVHVFEGRIETLGDHFDWVVMRAVAMEPLLNRLAGLASRAAFLAGSRASEVLERSDCWETKRTAPLPWGAPGRLYIAENTKFRRST